MKLMLLGLISLFCGAIRVQPTEKTKMQDMINRGNDESLEIVTR
jgi:hypothetical protein